MSTSSPFPHLPIDKHPYRILDILGQGGMGITYLAEKTDTQEKVALKTVSLQESENWKKIEFLEKEAEILEKLQHPSIPQYLDYFNIETETDKTFYLIRELAPGKSLQDWVKEGWRTTEEEVKNIAEQIINILIYLHGLNPPVIHRDIKPSNIIRDETGKVFLVDFGSVKHQYYTTLMGGSTLVGTYGYMPPEQYSGKAETASDLYSLGATLLYCLTHRHPGELLDNDFKLDRQCLQDLQLSEAFTDWLDKLVEHHSEDRFSSAKQALSALHNPGVNKAKTWVNQNWKTCVNLSLVGLILGLGILGFNYKRDIGRIIIKNDGSIHIAAAKGDIESVKVFLDNGFGINAKNNDGDTPLHSAKSKEIAELLINQGADVNVKNEYGSTPLDHAISRDEKGIAELLIKNGVDINARDDSGLTPLYWAISLDKKEIAELLIKNGADVNAKKNNGTTLLRTAISLNKKEIAELLIKNGSDVNAKNNDDHTLLQTAISRDQKEIAELLIKNGADVNAKNHIGEPFLHEVLYEDIFSDKKQIVQLLIENGVDINATDNSGITFLHRCIGSDKKEICELLIKNDVNINARNDSGETPLYWAIRQDKKEIIELLIENGADVNVKNNYGWTLLHHPMISDKKEIVELLIKNGANVNAKNEYDQTPLHDAISSDKKEIVELLIENGANLDAKDEYGYTPLDFAISLKKNREIIELLKKHGAKQNKS